MPAGLTSQVLTYSYLLAAGCAAPPYYSSKQCPCLESHKTAHANTGPTIAGVQTQSHMQITLGSHEGTPATSNLQGLPPQGNHRSLSRSLAHMNSTPTQGHTGNHSCKRSARVQALAAGASASTSAEKIDAVPSPSTRPLATTTISCRWLRGCTRAHSCSTRHPMTRGIVHSAFTYLASVQHSQAAALRTFSL